MFGLLKTFYIKPQERGLLFHRSHLRAILEPGTYRRWGGHWDVQVYDLNTAAAKIENLELLSQIHSTLLDLHLMLVRTGFDEVALVQVGQGWQVVPPNQLQAFWKGFIPVTVHRFQYDRDRQLPPDFVTQLRGQSLPGLYLIQIAERQMGMLYDRGNFIQPLEPGEYAFWTFGAGLTVQTYDKSQLRPGLSQIEAMLAYHRDFLEQYCEVVELEADRVAIVRDRGKVIAVLPPCSRDLFWKGVVVEQLEIGEEAKLSPALTKELVSGSDEVLDLCLKYLHIAEVPAQHTGLLYGEGAFLGSLAPGWHAWWTFGRSFKTAIIDLRLQTLEVTGQEILSKDKVPLRLNLTAGYRITDPAQATAQLADISGFLYKELQFALRAAVGTRTLDELLEDKGAIDRSIAEYILEKVGDYGLEIESVGVKDIILPGDMKNILCQVMEAEKSAQANVIRRREETAATRSMLNTARVMENNPVALRLKELEVLERIADKIDRITVNGGLEHILTDLIHLEGRSLGDRRDAPAN